MWNKPLLLIALLFLLAGPTMLVHSANQPGMSPQASFETLSSDSAQLSRNELSTNSERVMGDSGLVKHGVSVSELKGLESRIGVYEEGRNYNRVINGHGTGLRPPTSKQWMNIATTAFVAEKVVRSGTAQSPSVVDLTAEPWFPPIGDQGFQGSCTAWAIGYYGKTFQEAKEHAWNLTGTKSFPYLLPAYQDKIFSPGFIYNLINWGMDGGSSPDDAINLIYGIGECSWKNMPYNPNDYFNWPSEEAWKEAPWYRGAGEHGYMFLSSDSDLLNLKNWLASDNLAFIGVEAGQYYRGLTPQDVWTVDTYVNPQLDHENTVVGYDDSFAYVEEGQMRHGAFKIANSWGRGGTWEHVPDGCYWISYEAMKQRVGVCEFYNDRTSYKPELISSFHINHNRREDCSVSIGMGNHNDPLATKSFSEFVRGGTQPFRSDKIFFDITEFKDTVPTVYNQSFFIRVYDGASHVTGEVTYFSVQHAVSENPPVATVNWNSVFMDVTLLNTIRVPAHYEKIQQAINSVVIGQDPDPRVSILVTSGTYNETVIVDKTVSLIGENSETTIIDGGGLGNVTTVRADNVIIKGFTIRNSSASEPNSFGLALDHVKGCRVCCNVIIGNHYGIGVLNSQDCDIFHNSFEENLLNAWVVEPRYNLWDDGPLSGGNYWSNYVGADADGDGIGDSPQAIGESNVDRFPLMDRWVPPDIAVTNVTVAKKIVCQGFTLYVGVAVQNQANKAEIFNLTILRNSTLMQTIENISLNGGSSTTFTITWNTAGLPKGNYTITAYATPLPDETDTADNRCDSEAIAVVSVGDINADGEVDLRDVYEVAEAFGSFPGHLEWNAVCDMNGDSLVDIKDYYMVCRHYGEAVHAAQTVG